TGDGAGILTQIPHEFLALKCGEIGLKLPVFGAYGVGMVFFLQHEVWRRQGSFLLNDYMYVCGEVLIGNYNLPTNNDGIGPSALSVEPRMVQVFVKPKEKPKEKLELKALERKLYILRKYATHNIHLTYPQSRDDFYITSFSYKTIVYKGQLTTYQ